MTSDMAYDSSYTHNTCIIDNVPIEFSPSRKELIYSLPSRRWEPGPVAGIVVFASH